MKWGKLLLGVGWACVLYACSDDDGKDDTIMNMSELTGKYWYYNAWLGDKYGMGQSDLLEVIRFEKGGVLKMMEFGGRRVHAIGTWTGGDNQITMDLDDGDSIVWNVQRSGPDYIQTIVNAQGERKYTTDPGYLGELTADAFLVNEYTDGNQFKTYIGVDVRGNKNVKEVALIPADGKSIPVENHGYFWSERQPQSGDYVDFGGEKREVRFYLRIGKNTQLIIPGKGSFISPDLSSVDVKKSEALEKVALAVKEAIDHGVEKYELLQYIEQLLNIESAGKET